MKRYAPRIGDMVSRDGDGNFVIFNEAAAIIAEKDKDIEDRRNCMADIVRTLGHGQCGMEHREIVVHIANLQEQLHASNKLLEKEREETAFWIEMGNGVNNQLIAAEARIEELERITDCADGWLETHDKEVRAKALEDAAEWFDEREFVECTGNQIVITGYAEDELDRMANEIREGK